MTTREVKQEVRLRGKRRRLLQGGQLVLEKITFVTSGVAAYFISSDAFKHI